MEGPRRCKGSTPPYGTSCATERKFEECGRIEEQSHFVRFACLVAGRLFVTCFLSSGSTKRGRMKTPCWRGNLLKPIMRIPIEPSQVRFVHVRMCDQAGVPYRNKREQQLNDPRSPAGAQPGSPTSGRVSVCCPCNSLMPVQRFPKGGELRRGDGTPPGDVPFTVINRAYIILSSLAFHVSRGGMLFVEAVDHAFPLPRPHDNGHSYNRFHATF